MTTPNDTNEPSLASAGSHGDTLAVLRTLIDGVRGMGLGDPESGDRVEASDVVRWAVDEIARLREKETALLAAGDKLEQQLVAVAQQRDAMRLTDEEREAIEYGVLLCDATAGCANDRPTIDGASRAADVLRGLLRRPG
jgi:Arc/MetJ-type ribon-helix-helix transcriptional regulator